MNTNRFDLIKSCQDLIVALMTGLPGRFILDHTSFSHGISSPWVNGTGAERNMYKSDTQRVHNLYIEPVKSELGKMMLNSCQVQDPRGVWRFSTGGTGLLRVTKEEGLFRNDFGGLPRRETDGGKTEGSPVVRRYGSGVSRQTDRLSDDTPVKLNYNKQSKVG